MGSSKIEEILRDINSPKNKHGEVVKVVLMSPVAGEGLSLKNVREVHILDPWYHLNRLEQVIGRAFRTCHHVSLPLEERNVSVFIHVATASDDETTTDVNSYEIAARKAKEMEKVEKTIRDSAIDCPLFKNLNYFPRSLFQFDILQRSSRGVTIPCRFGDDADKRPDCPDPSPDPDATTVRRDAYKELIPTGIIRLKKYMKKNPTKVYFEYEELQNAIAMHPTIVKSVLSSATHDRRLGFRAHKNGFFVATATSKAMKPLSISISSVKPIAQESTDDCATIANQPVQDPHIAKILIYKALNSGCWDTFAKRIISYGTEIPQNIAAHVALLQQEGAFIGANELPRHKNPMKHPLIGFVDIFDASNSFKVTLFDHDRNMFRETTEGELSTIRAKRHAVTPSADEVYAVMEPHTYKKKFDVPITNEIKLFLPNVKSNRQTGIACESLKKNETQRFLEQFQVSVDAATKEQLCFTLGIELSKRGRLHFLPHLKPT
jgi:hypothetical protein